MCPPPGRHKVLGGREKEGELAGALPASFLLGSAGGIGSFIAPHPRSPEHGVREPAGGRCVYGGGAAVLYWHEEGGAPGWAGLACGEEQEWGARMEDGGGVGGSTGGQGKALGLPDLGNPTLPPSFLLRAAVGSQENELRGAPGSCSLTSTPTSC